MLALKNSRRKLFTYNIILMHPLFYINLLLQLQLNQQSHSIQRLSQI